MYEVVDFGALDEGKAFVVRGLNSAEEIVGGAATIGDGHRAFKLSRTGVLPASRRLSRLEHESRYQRTGRHRRLRERRDCPARLPQKTQRRDCESRHASRGHRQRSVRGQSAQRGGRILEWACGNPGGVLGARTARYKVLAPSLGAFPAARSPSTTPAAWSVARRVCNRLAPFSGPAAGACRISALSRAIRRAKPSPSTIGATSWATRPASLAPEPFCGHATTGCRTWARSRAATIAAPWRSTTAAMWSAPPPARLGFEPSYGRRRVACRI